MRRGIKSGHENEVNERNRVKEYEARTDSFRWNGSEEWPPMCESRKVRESAGRRNRRRMRPKRECENNTAYAPTRYVTRNGKKRKRLSVNWHKTILVKQSSTQRQPALRRFIRVCVYIQGVAAVIDALSKDQAFFGMHSLYETCGNKKIDNKESTESLHNDIYKMRVAICSGREAQPVSSEQPYTGDRD